MAWKLMLSLLCSYLVAWSSVSAQPGSADSRNPCRSEVQGQVQKSPGFEADGAVPISVGGFEVLCDALGDILPRQCHGGTGKCWCVDKYGNRLTPDAAGQAIYQLNCGAARENKASGVEEGQPQLKPAPFMIRE